MSEVINGFKNFLLECVGLSNGDTRIIIGEGLPMLDLIYLFIGVQIIRGRMMGLSKRLGGRVPRLGWPSLHGEPLVVFC